MFRTKLGLKVLGLCALVMGVMAIGSAGSAQATGCWGYINPTTTKLECFSKTLEATPAFAIENKTATLLISSQNFAFLCTEMALVEGGQLSAEGTVLPGRVKFKGCVTLINGVISKVCEPFDASNGEKGVILTDKVHALLILHKLEPSGVVDPMLLVLPDTVGSENLAKLVLGPECSVGEEIIIKGHLDLVDCQGLLGTHQVTHLWEESKTLQLMKVGINKASLDGSVNVMLAAPHLGYKWAGLAG
jgi:hypothetical protein